MSYTQESQDEMMRDAQKELLQDPSIADRKITLPTISLGINWMIEPFFHLFSPSFSFTYFGAIVHLCLLFKLPYLYIPLLSFYLVAFIFALSISS